MRCLVLDASAFIHGRDLRVFAGAVLYTTREIVEELRDPRSQAALDILKVEVVEASVEKVEELIKRFGLTKADATVLAVALEKRCSLVTDDGKLASVAKRLGVRVERIFYRSL
ncbi:MAG: PIN domain-containing protein [Pyrobaculum sp.]